MRIEDDSFVRTNWRELEAEIDQVDFSDRWWRTRRLVTDKGVYILSVFPLEFNGKPVRFDTNTPAD